MTSMRNRQTAGHPHHTGFFQEIYGKIGTLSISHLRRMMTFG